MLALLGTCTCCSDGTSVQVNKQTAEEASSIEALIDEDIFRIQLRRPPKSAGFFSRALSNSKRSLNSIGKASAKSRPGETVPVISTTNYHAFVCDKEETYYTVCVFFSEIEVLCIPLKFHNTRSMKSFHQVQFMSN